MPWTIEDSGPLSAFQNMDRDRELLAEVKGNYVRFYEWEGVAASYGCFIKPQDYFNLELVKALDIQLAPRPTGGGVLFHGSDWTVSIIVPPTHPCYAKSAVESYRYFNNLIAKAVQQVGLILPNQTELAQKKAPSRLGGMCMAESTIYDILCCGKKLAGAAQRKTKTGLLHQVSVSLGPPHPLWDTPHLMVNREWMSRIIQNSHPLVSEGKNLTKVRKQLNAALIWFLGAHLAL